jgi:hypothetical protein
MQKLRAVTILKKIITVSITVGSFAMLLTFLLWSLYATHRPTSPDLASGRVYRLAQHGLVVYQTKGEHIFYWGVSDCSLVLYGVAVLSIAAYEYISNK